jgi:hypothetical protein
MRKRRRMPKSSRRLRAPTRWPRNLDFEDDDDSDCLAVLSGGGGDQPNGTDDESR